MSFTTSQIFDPLQVNSNKISDVLAQFSVTALANVRHVRLTSTPGDDLAEEDFAPRVRSLLEPMTGLVALTICIPSMARLHPSNSLPKVLDVLREASILYPQCRLGLAVHEAEQAWSALTILSRIIELRLELHTIEFSRAFFPVAALIRAAQACGLASLSLHATQVFFSLSSDVVAMANDSPCKAPLSIPTLTSLAVDAHSEASPGLDSLIDTAASTVTHLDLSSSNSRSEVSLRGREFARLARLNLHEDLLLEATGARMPMLNYLIVLEVTRAESCETLQQMLHLSWLRVRRMRVLRVVAGDASDALMRLAETYSSVRVRIETLAVREPARLTPAALAISEHLVNAGPPIGENWPLGFGYQQYPLLKSIMLKVREGYNNDEFIACIDAPNLDDPPIISLVGKRTGKTGKK